MAFLTRSRRDFALGGCDTPQSLGPGSYDIRGSFSKKAGYAPFWSTAERGGTASPSIATPGPGSYGLENYRTSTGSPKQASAVFKTQTERFKIDVKDTPGPGYYKETTAFKPKRGNTAPAQVQGSRKPLNWVRTPTAPSIPGKSQSHGYEETPTGDLVMQDNPVQGFTGRNADTCGPAAYQPKLDFVKGKAKGTNFGRSRSSRSVFRTADTPGPGVYELSKKPKKPTNVGKSSSFASSVVRSSTAKTDDDTPGPGQYKPVGSIKAKFVPVEHQFFGSTSTRSSTAAKGRAPGPGQYDVQKLSAFKKKSLYAEPTTGFTSSSMRFSQRKESAVPGPGYYDEANTLVQKVERRVTGRNSTFNSTEKRESKLGDPQAANRPGPGSYDLDEQPFDQPYVIPSSSFASTNDRFRQKTADKGPAVGDYSISSKTGTDSFRRKPDSFLSTSLRFKHGEACGRKINDTPGPATYKSEVNPDPKIAHNTNAFISTANRFRHSAGKNPGPGEYEVSSPDAFVKKTFNVTIGEMTGGQL